MIRLANVLRRTLPLVPSRAGIPPTWDRPDPPASRQVTWKRRLTWDEIHLHFLDASTPTSMVVNPEVAEGDLIEAFPKFATQLFYFFAAAILVGSAGLLYGSYRSVWRPLDFEGQLQRQQTEKKQFDSKYGLKDLVNNPWKVNVWPENFPLQNWGKNELTYRYQPRQNAIATIRQINKEGLAFLQGLKAQVEEDLKKGVHH